MVIFDLVLMVSFLLAIWVIIHYVKNDVQRHRSMLFETKEFAMEFSNLPKLDQNYSIDLLKAELWSHIEKVIWTEEQ